MPVVPSHAALRDTVLPAPAARPATGRPTPGLPGPSPGARPRETAGRVDQSSGSCLVRTRPRPPRWTRPPALLLALGLGPFEPVGQPGRGLLQGAQPVNGVTHRTLQARGPLPLPSRDA